MSETPASDSYGSRSLYQYEQPGQYETQPVIPHETRVRRIFTDAVLDNQLGRTLDKKHGNPNQWEGFSAQLAEGETMVVGLASTDIERAYPLEESGDLDGVLHQCANGYWGFATIKAVPSDELQAMKSQSGVWSDLDALQQRFSKSTDEQ